MNAGRPRVSIFVCWRLPNLSRRESHRMESFIRAELGQQNKITLAGAHSLQTRICTVRPTRRPVGAQSSARGVSKSLLARSLLKPVGSSFQAVFSWLAENAQRWPIATLQVELSISFVHFNWTLHSVTCRPVQRNGPLSQLFHSI